MHLTVSFLPYLAVKDDIKIGDYILWSFYDKKDKYIQDETIRDHLAKLFAQYYDNSKNTSPLDHITIISYKLRNHFPPLSTYRLSKMRDAVNALCFASVVRNKEFSAVTNDDFHLVHQNFIPGSDGIAPTSGSIVQIKHGGYKIEEVKFIKPFNTCSKGIFLNFIYDKKIIEAYKALLKDRGNEELLRRISRSIEWVCHSYTNQDGFNYASRIVMMSTAFEILLDGFKGRYEFVREIEALTCDNLDKDKKWRSVRVIEDGGKKKSLNLSLKGWWAYEFYVLRNKIVHGKEIKSADFFNRKKNTYFLLAIKFYLECFKKILKSFYKYDFGDQILQQSIRDEL